MLAYLLDAVKQGLLVSYAAEQFRDVSPIGSLLDRILKGAKAVDVPVERPTKFELLADRLGEAHDRVRKPKGGAFY